MTQKYEIVKRITRELDFLYRIAETTTKYVEIKKVLVLVPNLLVENLGMNRSMITIYNRKTEEIFVESSAGLSTQEQERGKYRLGEGVIGSVFESGEEMIIPKIADEPSFLDKTGSRRKVDKKDISFICLPIKNKEEVIGTLSGDLDCCDKSILDEYLKILKIISVMIAQAVRLHQLDHEDRNHLVEENKRLKANLKKKFRPGNIVGNSKGMQQVYDLIEKVSSANATVLILGESGVGKELVAHAIHYNSSRANNAFITFNCAALPESIIDSELFGHEKGAFTGAEQARKGRFELANGGTIFLDEIGELTPGIQTKLLRVLQQKEFERVGGHETIKVDIRVIAATNRNLEEQIKKGLFREDLYYRLNIFPITIPPLRERKTDILLLADYFVNKYGKLNDKPLRRITTAAIDMLMDYHWPGNVRELENVIERASILSEDGVIHSYHLSPSLQTAESSGTRYAGSLQAKLDIVEHEMIIEALKHSHGNMAEAAKSLGITERMMGLRIKKYKIVLRKFRNF
ncbi:MAG: sigma 54-interacting transcriptional regulator [Ignavibacteria bacterium]|jgi:Nif-specific regulatory protein